MADTQEKKTYLIDFQDNIAAYAQRAADAKKAVNDLKAANKELIDSGKASAAQIEASNAALKVAEGEQRNATKLVQEAVKANNAQKDSYEELLQRWKLAQTQLKLMGDGYTTNANGVRTLSNKYIEQSKIVADAKKGLDQFGKGINDNRLNVGAYSEAIQGALQPLSMMPGLAGKAGTAMQGFVASFSQVAGAGGIGLVVAAVVGALAAIATPFIAFMKWSQEGIDLLAQKTAGWKAVITVLKGELINIGKGMTESIGSEKNVTTVDKLVVATKKFFTLLTGGFFQNVNKVTGLDKYWAGLKTRMDDAASAAVDYTKAEQLLEDEENKMLVTRAKSSLAIKEARLIYADTSKDTETRIAALKSALDLENRTADQEIDLAHKRTLIVQGREEQMKKAGQDTREQDKLVQQAIANELNLRTESVGREIRVTHQLQTARHELLVEEQKIVAAEEQLWEISAKADIDRYSEAKTLLKTTYDEETAMVGLSYEQREKLRQDFENANRTLDAATLQRQKDLLSAQLQIQLKQVDTVVQPVALANAQKEVLMQAYYASIQKMDADAANKLLQQINADNDRLRGIEKADIKARIETERLQIEDSDMNKQQALDATEAVLTEEYKAMQKSVEYASSDATQKLLIDEKYTAAKKQLSLARTQQGIDEVSKLGDVFGQMSAAFEKNTIASKMFAVAQATLAIYTAAAQAMADWSKFTVIQKIAAVGTILAEGATLISAINGVNTSMSTGVTNTRSTPALHRVAMPATGASSLSPSQAPAAQSAAAMSNMLTAESMQAMLKGLPAPIVTVEDINAKTKEVSKVKVRATI
jgi:hypothetical protein